MIALMPVLAARTRYSRFSTELKYRHGQMLIGRRCVSEPGVIGDIHQKARAPLPICPARFRQDALVTDHDAQFLRLAVACMISGS